MKAKWLMLGGVALFVISLAVHYVVKFLLGADEAVAIGLAIFVSPVIVLIGIAVYLIARFKKKTTP